MILTHSMLIVYIISITTLFLVVVEIMCFNVCI